MASSATSTIPRRNQFGDDFDEDMTIEHWNERWMKGQTKFHMPKVHPLLQKHYGVLTSNSNKPGRIFLPMCGKSLDMPWLAQKGHHVIGNEYIDIAVQQFYQEHNLEYTCEPIGAIEGSLYKSKSSQMKIDIYCCDFYKLTKEIIGEVDYIWDRGSLAGINIGEREKYSKTLVQLLSPTTRSLMEVFLVDHTYFIGPPHTFSSAEVPQLFESVCNTIELEVSEAELWFKKAMNLKYFTALLYIITLRQSNGCNK